MEKTTIKFTAAPFEVNGHTGYRPVLEAQPGKFDLPFCKEVVAEKRLQTSPDELLHDVEMLAEVATAKVASDGRPRGITKLIKWNRFASGNLESPTSPWNESCKAVIRPQLLGDAVKEIDANFVNVESGVGVKLNYVAWLGAQSVINVVKTGKDFAAYGNHMEWLTGDSASLVVGTQTYALTCTESDVAHAVFSWPSGLAPEAGTQAVFVMKSRGGVEEGEVYTSRKTVTILAADPVVTPMLVKAKQGTRIDNNIGFGTTSTVITCVLPGGFKATDGLKIDGAPTTPTGTDYQATMSLASYVTASTETSITLGNGFINDSGEPDSAWNNKNGRVVLVRDGVEYALLVTFSAAS